MHSHWLPNSKGGHSPGGPSSPHGRLPWLWGIPTSDVGREYRDETEYLRVYIRYLRQKIEDDPSHPILILTEPGVGYRFAQPPAPATP